MADSKTDRDLFFGILALQMGLITHDRLIAALKTCIQRMTSPWEQVLQSQGDLSADDDGLLESLVCRLMEKHDNNARRSLAAVTTVSRDTRQDTREDRQVRTELLHLAFAPNAAELDRRASGRRDRLTRPNRHNLPGRVSVFSGSTPEAASARSGSPRIANSIEKWH